MTITLTREEAQQILDALEQVTKQMLSVRDELAERGARPITNTHYQKLWDSAFAAYTEYALPAAETLRTRLAQPEPDEIKWDASAPLVMNSHPAFAKSKRVYCSCGDGIVPDDGALCGTCASLRNAT